LPSTTSIGAVTSTELGYLDGVTSAIQTQLGTKAPLAGPTFTGTVTLPSTTVATTQTAGNSSTAPATTAFVQATVGSVGTMASQNANAVAITGGTIAGVAISGATIASSTIGGLTLGTNGTGTKTISTSTPTGGSDGDIWYQVS